MDISKRFESVSGQLGVGHAVASFHPYSELKHTWRREGDRVTFKISDYLKDSPEDVLESMAWYLVCRAFRRKCPVGHSERYLVYSRSSELWSNVNGIYLARSKNLILEPRGKQRNLSSVFDYVNSNYFRGKIRNPILAWVAESPSQRLGFYFAPLNLLAVNTAFDSERVPRYVLEFVVYHELLHHLDATDGKPRRRVHHTKSFKEQERLFSSYADAERWLRRVAAVGRDRRRWASVPRA